MINIINMFKLFIIVINFIVVYCGINVTFIHLKISKRISDTLRKKVLLHMENYMYKTRITESENSEGNVYNTYNTV